MNTNNHGTPEACKRLVDAGIVLETDIVWWEHEVTKKWELGERAKCGGKDTISEKYLPAPSMAEVWQELPIGTRLIHRGTEHQVYLEYYSEKILYNINPTDALIDLLIYVKKGDVDI